jgi:hypothetical protein
MPRSRLFISYSQRDGDWMERLKLHLALLERRGIVHVWSDTQIRIGDRWEAEIESALAESRAAVLLITPAFLASSYIQEQELPRILEHAADGMRVLPLIARPCAWRVAPELAGLQARPRSGRALSLGSEPAVDSDLADFAYELASILGQMPSSMAREELEKSSPAEQALRASAVSGEVRDMANDPATWLQIGSEWTGKYVPTNRAMRLVISRIDDSGAFKGSIRYTDDDAVTDVAGRVLERSEAMSDATFTALMRAGQPIDGAIRFREKPVMESRKQPLDLDGDYFAVIIGRRLSGVWRGRGAAAEPFEFVCAD